MRGMELAHSRVVKFQEMIWSWWEENKRDLPWRRTNDPYKILVSEIMLQQTQVSRVLPKYDEFLYFFPDIETLAHASAGKVLRVWKGMGYNRRALYLRDAAKIIHEKYHGEIPEEEKKLKVLPGIGDYTLRAILVFGLHRHLAFVDTNIRRILTHYFFRDIPQKPSAIHKVADQLLPEGKAWEWHQALMDYGALQLPKMKRSERKRRATIPFRQSNRFYRGRIVDLLRRTDMRKTVLINELIHLYGKDAAYYRSLLTQLVREGLVVYKDGSRVGLPE